MTGKGKDRDGRGCRRMPDSPSPGLSRADTGLNRSDSAQHHLPPPQDCSLPHPAQTHIEIDKATDMQTEGIMLTQDITKRENGELDVQGHVANTASTIADRYPVLKTFAQAATQTEFTVENQGILVTALNSSKHAADRRHVPDRLTYSDWSLVHDQAKESLFFVMIKSMGKEADKQIRAIAEKAKSMTRTEMFEALKVSAFLSTGFAVGKIGDELVILTTLHSLSHIFRASTPITAKKMNKLFMVELLCSHYEERYRQAESKCDRAYAVARVLSVDCAKDMLLLAVKRSDLKNFAGGSCPEDHSPLRLCAYLDGPTTECLMVSWPAYKPDTISMGRIGVPRRVEEINSKNMNEYDMELLEIYMDSVEGSSGAPLVNRYGQVIGVLHGGHGEPYSYFLRFRDLVTFVSGSLDPGNFPRPAIGDESSTSSKQLRAN